MRRPHSWKRERVIFLGESKGFQCENCRKPLLDPRKFNIKKWLENHRSIPEDYPTLDHIKPKSLGGSWDISNLRLLCPRCNNHDVNMHIPRKTG